MALVGNLEDMVDRQKYFVDLTTAEGLRLNENLHGEEVTFERAPDLHWIAHWRILADTHWPFSQTQSSLHQAAPLP